MVIILLTIIAVSEIIRLFLAYKPVSRKDYFKQKREGLKRMIADYEFKNFKTKEQREEVRKEYDNDKHRLSSLEDQIKTASEEGVKTLQDSKVLLEKRLAQAEQAMKQLDAEVEGLPPSADYPNGVAGTNQQITSLNEVLALLNKWLEQM